MGKKKVLRKLFSGIVISNLLLSTIFCYSPYLPNAAAAVKQQNLSILPYLQGLRNQDTARDQRDQTASNSENGVQYNISSKQTNLLNDNNNQTDLTQEEIDKKRT